MNLDEINKEIQELQTQIQKLQEIKIEEESKTITKDLVEGKYYKFYNLDPHTNIYFKYNKNNFVVFNGAGDNSFVEIGQGIEKSSNRISLSMTWFFKKAIPAKRFLEKDFNSIKIEEITEEDFKSLKEQLVNFMESL